MVYHGHWNDGRTARREPVRVRLVGRTLALTTAADDRPLLDLPVDGLRLTEEVYADRPLRLAHAAFADARLTVDDTALLAALRRVAPRLGRRDLSRHGAGRRFLVWSGALVAALVGMIVAVPLASGPIARMLPMEWEAELGRTAMQSLLEGERECTAAAGAAALAGLTARLEQAAGAPMRFQVRVIDDERVNALAAPGGHIVLLGGLLQQADSPEVVAAVLAHEMAHGLERHSTRAIVNRLGYGLVFSALTGDLSSALGLVAQSGEVLLNLAHSRRHESEADRRALELLHAAGIDSRGLGAFFAKLQAEHGDRDEPIGILSTHPLHAERIAAAAELERAGAPALTAEQWAALQAVCVTDPDA